MNKSAPLVSVIIPTFNREKWVIRALQSVLKQRKVPLEVVVVNDGSTDHTTDAILNFKKRHPAAWIRIVNQANHGPAHARNVGIRETSGPYVAFLDSDDEWLPGKLDAQLAMMNEQPDLLICQTDEIWMRRGRRVNPMKKHIKRGGQIFEASLELCLISPSCVMIKRELFDKIGLFDERLPVCEDYDLWLRVTMCHQVGYLRTPFVIRYGGHQDQRSKAFEVMDRFRIQSLVKLLRTPELTDSQRAAVLKILGCKIQIVRQGALKRGRLELVKWCDKIVSQSFERIKKPAAHEMVQRVF